MSSSAYMEQSFESKSVGKLVETCNRSLQHLGMQTRPLDAERLALWFAATFSTLAAYYIFFGKRHRRRRKHLYEELLRAKTEVARLEEKLLEAASEEGARSGQEIRIWMDGAFDMMHYGHMNAFRQGKALGTCLVVGVNSDESIAKCKGPPVMNDEERLTAVKGCKFVDEVVPNVPYVMSEEYLDHVIEKHRIDYVVHGDDPCIVDGKDVYASAKARGKYRSIPRTEGVSTTDIVGRMLLQSRSHHSHRTEGHEIPRLASFNRRNEPTQPAVRSKFLTTSWMLRLFSAGVQAPPKGAKVVYVDGAWDMFHAGHVAILQKAREFGDYLIAGVHSDEVVNSQRGFNMPIMDLNERVLSVLGCAYVNDVLIDAPMRMTREMIASLKICAVVHGTVDDSAGDVQEGLSPYSVAQEMGIYHRVDSPSNLTVMEIVGRIEANQELFQRKYARKIAAEDEYYQKRYKILEEDTETPSGTEDTT